MICEHLAFKIPEYDKAKPGDLRVTLERCFDSKHILGYIQVVPSTVGDLDFAKEIASLPLFVDVCRELAKEPYEDSDPESLLKTLRARAKLAFDIVEAWEEEVA